MSTLIPPEVTEDTTAQIIASHKVEEKEMGPHKRLISAHDYLRMAEIGLFEG